MKTAVIITGIRDIDRKLRTLEPRVQKKYVRQAIRAGLKTVATAVKSEAPVESGLTKSAVKVRAVKKRKRTSIELEVMIDSKTPGLLVTRTASKAFYPSIVTYIRNNFMQRAFESSGESARQTAITHLRAGIEAEASK